MVGMERNLPNPETMAQELHQWWIASDRLDPRWLGLYPPRLLEPIHHFVSIEPERTMTHGQ